jgi:hypothetical protein
MVLIAKGGGPLFQAGEDKPILRNGKPIMVPNHVHLERAWQEDDGRWGYQDDDSKFHPFEEKYPDGYKIMAWGQLMLSVDAVGTMCDESNSVNYDIQPSDRDYVPTDLIY